MSPRLIGLCGYARSGKDTAAEYLAAEHGYERRAFADKLRALALAIDPPVLGPDGYESWSQQVSDLGYEEAKRYGRGMLVRLGAGVREVLGPDVWVDALLPPTAVSRPARATMNLLGAERIVVSDVRYLNEVQRIIDLGGEVWYINRRLLNPANPEEARSFREIFDSPLLDHPRFRVLPNMGDGPTTLYPRIEELLRPCGCGRPTCHGIPVQGDDPL